MIDIALTNGGHVRFNLKDRDDEKPFRDAWYSMSDTRKYASRQLTAVTDLDESYVYKISDIKDCRYTDAVFDYKGESILDDLFDEIAREEELEREEPVEAEENVGVDRFREIMKLFNKIRNLLNDVIESIPEDHRDKIVYFLRSLDENHVHIDLTDSYLMETLVRVIQGGPQDVPYLVQTYATYWKNNRRAKEA